MTYIVAEFRGSDERDDSNKIYRYASVFSQNIIW